MSVAQHLEPFVRGLLGTQSEVRILFWDGSALGPDDADSTIVVRSPVALRRMITAPGELGLGRAYVAGEIDLEGPLEPVIELRDRGIDLKTKPADVVRAVRAAASVDALRPLRLSPLAEEARLHGRRHSRARDAAAISHHYDVSNEFYEIVLGLSMTYSCAYFSAPECSLEQAQMDKHELICRKLRLREDERLLDIGCGWGSLAIHAASRFGVRVVGVTLARPQAELARKRVADAGMTDRVEIRLQDERDVNDGPYDAIASVGMFEHVGAERLSSYFRHIHDLLRPQGRLLNHGISRPPGQRSRFARRGFIDSFVFPDGELHEIGRVVSIIQECGLEVRDVESLREHYALTLRRWGANLEGRRERAVELAGEGRYRVWRLYMAASAQNFQSGRTQVHQVLAVRSDGGVSGLPLRRGDTVLD